jgi:hypothetical protein
MTSVDQVPLGVALIASVLAPLNSCALGAVDGHVTNS